MLFKYGLKLWSNNSNYADQALKLYANKIFDYIELYAAPGTFEQYIDLWKSIDIPYVIHAPHWYDGMNLADKANKAENRRLFSEAQRYADELMAEKIILHPGVGGDINETQTQIRELNDQRILVENKPYYALEKGFICNGTTPEEIEQVMNVSKVGFCLDIGHAFCSANAQGYDRAAFINAFLALKPRMFHLTDGDRADVLDRHLHIGQGNYDVPKILSLLPVEAMITVETCKDSESNLDDYIGDLLKLRSYERN